MKKLSYLQNYNTFRPNSLNESLGDSGQQTINKSFMNMGEIKLSNGESLNPKDIVDVVNKAISWLAEEFRTYYSFAQDSNIIYLVNDPNCTTMCVDESMNIYMDVLFIYNQLEMNPQYVATVIMHEIFHIIYNHIERGKNWLSAQGKPINKETFFDTNLAGDVEVNTTLINKNFIDKETFINKLGALFLNKTNNDRTNLPMEDILENEKLMNILREKVHNPQNNQNGQNQNGQNQQDQKEHVKTSKEWDNGYKSGWDKIVELIDKYGAKDTMKKLQENGICDEQGNFIEDIENDTIITLEFLVIKSFSQFLLENKNSDKFKNYDDGFKTGVKKAISLLKNSIFGQDNNTNQQQDNIIPDTDLKKEDLKKLNLPQQENSQTNNNDNNDNLPTNINDDKSSNNNQQSNGEQSGEKNNNQQSNNSSSSNQGQQQSNGEQSGKKTNNQQSNGSSSSNQGQQQESTTDDINKLVNDLKNKSQNNHSATYADKPRKSSRDDENMPINSTGSFMNDTDSSFAKKALKNSGYSEEDIDNIINKTIEKNKRLNTQEGIIEKRKKLYSKLSSGDIVRKLIDNIEISESKYKNIWKKIMKTFLGTKCRHSQRQVKSNNFDWKNKRTLSLGRLSPRFHKEPQAPQNINVYVDVSGSVNVELLEVISKSLCLLCKEYEYSGINIIPWASSSTGIHEVKKLYESTIENVSKEILGYISEGISQCGGGTDILGACLPEIISIVKDKSKHNDNDDKHIIITDGETFGDEEKIESIISSKCGSKTCKNCFYMIYDVYSRLKSSWESSIKLGTLLFIDSEVTINYK